MKDGQWREELALNPTTVKITKKSDDPTGITRVSLGGIEEIGFYCTYRGTRDQALKIVRQALLALENMAVEPPVSPDDGKKYA